MSAISRLTRAGLRVTLVDGHLYSTFQPLLYQVATAGLNPGDVAYPAGGFARRYGAVYRRGELAAIDPASRRIKLTNGRDLGYDYLILATGVTTAFYGVKGAAEHTFGLYTRTDAIVLRDHLMAAFERLSVDRGDLHVTVVGGGATGVELAGTLAELRGTVLGATFPDVDPARVHVRLVEMAPYLLGPFHEKLREYARTQLLDRGVDVRLDTRIGEVTANQVRLAHGEDLPSDITVWAAGVAASPAVAGWGLPQGKNGRIVVGPDLRVQGQDRIFAVGDIAVNPDDPTPQLAQPALQMGRHAAAQIVRLETSSPTAHWQASWLLRPLERRRDTRLAGQATTRRALRHDAARQPAQAPSDRGARQARRPGRPIAQRPARDRLRRQPPRGDLGNHRTAYDRAARQPNARRGAALDPGESSTASTKSSSPASASTQPTPATASRSSRRPSGGVERTPEFAHVRSRTAVTSYSATEAETISARCSSLGPSPRNDRTAAADSHRSNTLIRPAVTRSAASAKSRHPGVLRPCSMTSTQL